MDPDLALILGLVVAGFSIPSMLSAFSDKRAPRASALTLLIAGFLIIFALSNKPGGYPISTIPDVFVAVMARYVF